MAKPTIAWQEVDIVNRSGQALQQLFRKLTNDHTWLQQTFDLSKYAGQTIGLQFLDHEQSNGGSFFAYMHVDDVTLTVQRVLVLHMASHIVRASKDTCGAFLLGKSAFFAIPCSVSSDPCRLDRRGKQECTQVRSEAAFFPTRQPGLAALC